MAAFHSTAAQTHLLPGEARNRRDRNRAYMMSLKNENLLLSHYIEAGLVRIRHKPEGIHWGWDSPLSDIRGTFLGHWLSAAAHMARDTNDIELLAKANTLVSEIGRCQQANGGQWAFPIPQHFLHDLKRGKAHWAPQYVCHKNMMGLLDMYRYAGNEQALAIVKGCADWFYDFTNGVDRETMSDMMDMEETGGIMELWADLYEITRDPRHLTLMERYERPRLFDPLTEGVDVLTNMHANATIPEAMGYARAYEVTGNDRYRKAVEAYWRCAVTERGAFATGGQTAGEIWTAKQKLAARLSDKNQEHCTVYHMMRLADYLLRWTGDSQYADYYEKNLYNGIYAQGYWRDETEETLMAPHYRETTTVAYFLPMLPGSVKHWGSETEHFWCCHCTLLQANAMHHESVFYQTDYGIAVTQYIEAQAALNVEGVPVQLVQTRHGMTGGSMMRDFAINREIEERPMSWNMQLIVSAEKPVECAIAFRVPEWIDGEMQISVNGQSTSYELDGKGFAKVRRVWQSDTVHIAMGKRLTCAPLPDDPKLVAFLDGPVCLAGLTDKEYKLVGDINNPNGTLLAPCDERHWQRWRTGWKTYHQQESILFKPLYQIGREAYTLYFPIEP